MSTEKRKLCSFGDKCTKKNGNHKKLYFHPQDDTEGNKLRKTEELAAEIGSLQQTDELDFLSAFHLKLTGPYCVMDNHISHKFEGDDLSIEDCMLVGRFYYDVPEFQTVIMSSENSFHIGYYRDDPSEMPVMICSNRLDDGCKLNVLGDNIIGALHYHLSAMSKQKSTLQSRSIIERLTKLAEKKSLCLKPSMSQKIKQRKKLVVADTFHGAGIVVPVVNDVGYRNIGENPATLRNWLKIVDESEEQTVRDEKLDQIHELINYVQFANDECDYGMGLELGIDLFCSGCRLVHRQIKQLLKIAYQLLNRDIFAKLIEVHLEHRNVEKPFNFDFE